MEEEYKMTRRTYEIEKEIHPSEGDSQFVVSICFGQKEERESVRILANDLVGLAHASVLEVRSAKGKIYSHEDRFTTSPAHYVQGSTSRSPISLGEILNFRRAFEDYARELARSPVEAGDSKP